MPQQKQKELKLPVWMTLLKKVHLKLWLAATRTFKLTILQELPGLI
jgi:hypothetical protein